MRAILVLLLLSSPVFAQETTVPTRPAFSVDRLTPAPGAGTLWQVEDGDVGEHLRPTFAFVTSLSTQPLIVRHTLDGSTLSEPVALRVGGDLLAAIGLLDRYQIGLAVPVVIFQDGDRLQGLDLPGDDADQPLASTTIGDVRLHAKVRVVEPKHGLGFAAAGVIVATLPTGDDEHFAGEAGPVFEGRLVGSYRHRLGAVALNVGARIRTEEVEFLVPELRLGNELVFGGGLEVGIPKTRARALVEVVGVTDIDAGPSPGEARAGGRYRIGRAWVVGAGFGLGIGDDRAIGAPGVRFLLEVRHEPSPRVDSDHDGVPDVDDLCPREVEDVDHHQDSDGCIDEDDDGDNIPDTTDQCSDEKEDFDRYADSDGCPDPDNDGDGILDAADRCPGDAEDEDGFADDDGCVDGDNDSDGVKDPDDRCKDEAEDRDGFEDEDGCPEADNDRDGVGDATDRCPTEVEDPDGFRDEDGCLDSDDDRDGVPDGVDACLDQPETITGTRDGAESDGCADGTPLVRPTPDGKLVFAPAATKALTTAWKKGGAVLSADAAVVVKAVARAAHRAGWDEAKGEALVVTAFGDAAAWDDLAQKRSEAIVSALAAEGVRARVEAQAAGKAKTIVFTATPEALEAGPTVPVKQPSVPAQ